MTARNQAPKSGQKSRPVNSSATPAGVKKDGAESASGTTFIQVEHLRVRSLHDSFRRCGRSFGKQSVDIPLTELYERELEILEAEPALATQRVLLDIGEVDQEGEESFADLNDTSGSGGA